MPLRLFQSHLNYHFGKHGSGVGTSNIVSYAQSAKNFKSNLSGAKSSKVNGSICMDENRFSFLGKYVKEFLPVPFIWIRTPNCLNRVIVKRLTPNMFDVELQVFLCLQNHLENGGTYQLFPGVRKVIMPK